MAYVQKNNPFNVTPCGRRRTFMHDNAPMTITSPNTYMEVESPLEKRKKEKRATSLEEQLKVKIVIFVL